MRRVCLVMVLLVSGCNGTPANFWRGLTRGLCKYNRDCGLKYDHDSVGACAEARYAASMEPDEFADECGEYNRESAFDCLQYLGEARDSCETLERYPKECRGVCGPGSQIEFAVEQPAQSAVVTPLLAWDAE